MVDDVVIAGGGFAGLSLAVALKRAGGEALSVVVCDPALARGPSTDRRASAIAAASIRLLDGLGVWATIEPTAQVISQMVITDSRTQDVVRPTLLTFGGDVAPGEAFGYMVENRVLLAALTQRARDLGVVLLEEGVRDFSRSGQAVTVVLNGTASRTARLLVAADGVRSALREKAGIDVVGWDYEQSGIVCTIRHERPHEGVATEHFLPSGPFAMLPLRDNHSSIVWTERRARAERLVKLPKVLFQEEIETRFGLKLGDIEVVDTPRCYPLHLQVARRFVGDRFALLGDAAHFMHPIAGQGMNYGFKDVAALAECLIDAARLGLDPGAADVLERYERWRRFDTVAMGMATDGLNRLFSNNSDSLRMLRDLGLGLVERMPRLKGFFIRNAAGLIGDVPRLMRGEAL